MSSVQRVAAGWRQLRYPAAFRIAPPIAPPVSEANPGEPAPGEGVPTGMSPGAPSGVAGADAAPAGPGWAGTPGTTSRSRSSGSSPDGSTSPGPPSDTVSPGAVSPGPDPGGLSDAVVSGLATDLWRARRRVTGESAAQRPDRALRMAARPLGGAVDQLRDAGIEIHDHDGQAYDPGMRVEVMAHQEEPGLAAETIIETVRPTVRREGRVIQQAEVIVGMPPREPGAEEEGQEHA